MRDTNECQSKTNVDAAHQDVQWLPKDERRLLKELYRITEQSLKNNRTPFNQELRVNISDLTNKVFLQQIDKDLGEWGLRFRHILSLLVNLRAYNVIVVRQLDENVLSIGNLPSANKEARITFTTSGYQLAKQYSNPWLRSRLWYNHFFRHHPLIVIIAFILGSTIVESVHLILKLLSDATP